MMFGSARLGPSAQANAASISTIRRLRVSARVVPPSPSPTPSEALANRPSPARLRHENPRNMINMWFSPTGLVASLEPTMPDGSRRPDDRKVKLGRTLRILQERLPTLLQSPLPQDILAPNISLHLFPSTHQHLPVVSGRVAYVAALWTSPIAWNRVPLIGNNRLEILSERMVDQPVHSSPRRAGATGEQLIVRWRSLGDKDGAGKTPAAGEFVGLFIFEFDAEGRILSHTIETVQEGGQWEKGVGAKVVGLTDWLLGNIKRGGASESGLATCQAPPSPPINEG